MLAPNVPTSAILALRIAAKPRGRSARPKKQKDVYSGPVAVTTFTDEAYGPQWPWLSGSETLLNGGETMLNGSQTMLNGGQTMLNDGESMQNGGASMPNGNQRSKKFAAPARCVRGFSSFWPDNSSLVGVTTPPDKH
jgi:hypothetical protein